MAAPRRTTIDLTGWRPTRTQERFLESRKPRVLFSGGYGSGKALALDTEVPTAAGWRTMGTVAVGDILFDERGRPCRVTSVHDVMRDRPCFRVSFDDGSSIVADAGHLWAATTYAERKRARREQREAKCDLLTTGEMAPVARVRKGSQDHANFAIPVVPPVELPAAPLPIDPYLLGIWLGDGDSAGAHFTGADESIASRLRSRGHVVEENTKARKGNARRWLVNRTSAIVSDPETGRFLRGEGLHSQLRALGVLGNKQVPEMYLRASIDQRRELLAGFVDTDGHVSPRGRVEVSQSKEHLARAVETLAASLGYKVTVREGAATLHGREVGRRWRVCWTATNPVASMPRKASHRAPLSQQRDRIRNRYIVSIDSVPSVPVRCIRVDSPSHLFCVTRRFIPTHNTATGAEAAVMLALENPGCAGLVVSPTWQMLTRTTHVALMAALPRALIRRERRQERAIDLINGSTIYYGSADRPGSLEGTNLAWAWIDEARLINHEAFRIIVGRVRDRKARRSQIIVTTTPAMGWLHDEFGEPGRESHDMFIGSTRENAHNLKPGFIPELEATYSKRLAQALIDGKFVLATGAVYEEFDESRHVIDWPDLPHAETILGIDFGVVSPAVIVAQLAPFDVPVGGDRVVPRGSIVIVDEVMPDQTPTIRLAPVIQQLSRYRPGMTAYVDPAGGARSQAEGRTSHAILRDEALLRVEFSRSQEETYIPNGVALVKQALDPIDGVPALYVARSVAAKPQKRGVLQMMRGYRYPEKDGRQTSDQPVKDGLVDHCADALRYLVVGALRDRGRVGTQMLQRTLLGYAPGMAA